MQGTSQGEAGGKGASFGRTPALIKVVGVGGGGCNAVRRMIPKRVPGVEFIVVNTDIKSLESVKGATAIQIGEDTTHGWGAGGKPEVGAASAEKMSAQLKKALKGADLIFVTAGMGGGTGTGAAPVVGEIARSSGALTVGVVTTPFSFEGKKRLDQAIAGVGEFKKHVDKLVVIHNDRLLTLVDQEVPMEEAFAMADEVVMHGILGIASLINVPGDINVDLADVKAVMAVPGTALMAVGQGEGSDAAVRAAKQAINNPLLNISINGAKGALFNVSGGPDLTIGQVNAAGEIIAKAVDPDAMIFFGMVNDQNMEGKARITLIATGIPAGETAVNDHLKDLLGKTPDRSADFRAPWPREPIEPLSGGRGSYISDRRRETERPVEVSRPRTWKPTVAGILSIIAGTAALLAGVSAVWAGEMISGGSVDWTSAVVAVVVGLVSILGGIFAIRRRIWGLALAGAICALLPAPATVWGNELLVQLPGRATESFAPQISVLGILAIVFLALSKDEFN